MGSVTILINKSDLNSKASLDLVLGAHNLLSAVYDDKGIIFSIYYVGIYNTYLIVYTYKEMVTDNKRNHN